MNITTLIAVLVLAFAPAPFPQPRRPPIPLAKRLVGEWDKAWGDSMTYRITLRADGRYTAQPGSYFGTWHIEYGWLYVQESTNGQRWYLFRIKLCPKELSGTIDNWRDYSGTNIKLIKVKE